MKTHQSEKSEEDLFLNTKVDNVLPSTAYERVQLQHALSGSSSFSPPSTGSSSTSFLPPPSTGSSSASFLPPPSSTTASLTISSLPPDSTTSSSLSQPSKKKKGSKSLTSSSSTQKTPLQKNVRKKTKAAKHFDDGTKKYLQKRKKVSFFFYSFSTSLLH
jgi:hypothetical protein